MLPKYCVHRDDQRFAALDAHAEHGSLSDQKDSEKLPTLVIGIPAHNEEANIAVLLNALKRQKISSASLKKILVVADGCTDATVSRARSVGAENAVVADRRDRRGLNATQNYIVSQCLEDILVLLDADILPADDFFINRLIQPIVRGEAGMVSGRLTPMPAQSFFESTLECGARLKNQIFDNVKKGSNVYHCHGGARAFSYSVYAKLRWPLDCAEDGYSYLWCAKEGIPFTFEARAESFYRLPSNVRDHLKQSLRFQDGKKTIMRYFERNFVLDAYHIPLSAVRGPIVRSLMHRPLLTTLYFLTVAISKLFGIRAPKDHTVYQTSLSSKKVSIH